MKLDVTVYQTARFCITNLEKNHQMIRLIEQILKTKMHKDNMGAEATKIKTNINKGTLPSSTLDITAASKIHKTQCNTTEFQQWHFNTLQHNTTIAYLSLYVLPIFKVDLTDVLAPQLS